MHNLEINIPRKFLWFSWYKRIKGEYPEKWDEMNKKQLIGVVKALHTTTDQYLFRAFAIGAILGFKRWQLKIFSSEFMIQLWWLFDFIEKENGLTKNIMPMLKVRNGWFRLQKLTGPGDNLQHVVAIEWMYAERFCEAFRLDGDINDLRRLVACLYRVPTNKPLFNPDYNGDGRQPFNVNIIDKTVAQLKRVNIYKLLAIMHWYEGCKFAIAQQFFRVFTNDGEVQPEHYGWAEVFLKIAKDGVFGDINMVNQTEMTTLLLHMQISAKDAEKKNSERSKQNVE